MGPGVIARGSDFTFHSSADYPDPSARWGQSAEKRSPSQPTSDVSSGLCPSDRLLFHNPGYWSWLGQFADAHVRSGQIGDEAH